jgi:cell division FtsZ-interacting protein ZapD
MWNIREIGQKLKARGWIASLELPNIEDGGMCSRHAPTMGRHLLTDQQNRREICETRKIS